MDLKVVFTRQDKPFFIEFRLISEALIPTLAEANLAYWCFNIYFKRVINLCLLRSFLAIRWVLSVPIYFQVLPGLVVILVHFEVVRIGTHWEVDSFISSEV